MRRARGERAQFCLQHDSAWFGRGHMQHRRVVRSASWEVFLRLNKEDALIKWDFCVSFYFIYSFVLSTGLCMYRKSCIHIKTHSTKHPIHEHIRLFALEVGFYSLDSLEKAKEEERRKEEFS